jgi:Tol biopolymer transport system component
VSSASTRGFSDGFIPRQLTHDTSDIPTDTKGNLIAFMSHREGNWEAYVMDLNGAGVRNLSNTPDSADGLPTISLDGNWLAFTSNRGGRWAVWAVSIAGGSAQKLFDLPEGILWSSGDRDWTNERISWGL